MLPGLRFLFVAIVLSLSMMIFGLGAAALLRAAHQEVASLPARHVQPETVFAQQTTPTLAMLRLDAPVPEAPVVTAPQELAAPTASAAAAPTGPDRVSKPEPTTEALASHPKPEAADKSAAPAPQAPAARTETPVQPSENHPLEPRQPETQAAVNAEPASPTSGHATTAALETPAAEPAPAVAAATPAPATANATPTSAVAAPEIGVATAATPAAEPAT